MPGGFGTRGTEGMISAARWAREKKVPYLGICLGFQSLCLAFGANVGRLREPRHGIMAMIAHSNSDVFAEPCARNRSGRRISETLSPPYVSYDATESLLSLLRMELALSEEILWVVTEIGRQLICFH